MKLLTEKDALYHCFKSQKREGKSRISKRLGTHRGIGDTIKCFLLLLERHPVRPCSCSLLELRFFHGGNTGSNPVGDAKSYQELTSNGSFSRRHKKEYL